jgi:hypothetical protein
VAVVSLFQLDGWDVSAVFEQPPMVEPVDVLQDGDLDLLDGLPWTLGFDQFGLEQADHRLGEGVVIGVTDAAVAESGLLDGVHSN